MQTEPAARGASALDLEWRAFLTGKTKIAEARELTQPHLPQAATVSAPPPPGPLHISTKTKIVYLDDVIALDETFWNIKVSPYATTDDCVLKKQMKATCTTPADSDALVTTLKAMECATHTALKGAQDEVTLERPYIAKVNIGICKKDLITSRNKPATGAFYNSFMLVLRVDAEGKYNEVNLKVFNTGKVSFPGKLSPALLDRALDVLCSLLTAARGLRTRHLPESIETVLINSNFNCGFYIDRPALADILKYEYGFYVSYDPCSYPGIQCKYFMTSSGKMGNGVCSCTDSCAGKRGAARKGRCKEVSFMVFRTGSVLIVGHVSEEALRELYETLSGILAGCYDRIRVPGDPVDRSSRRVRNKPRRRTIMTRPRSPPPA